MHKVSKIISLTVAAMLALSCSPEQMDGIIAMIASLLDSGTEVSGGDDGVTTTAGGSLELPASRSGEHVITHTGYTTSYNTTTLIPDWVAYELTASETEGYEERGERMFSKDPQFRQRQAMREDYSGSGWTKGHMAPAADFRWDSTAMDETFYFTNVCPQDQQLNSKDWEFLERQVRRWANEYGRVWVVTGPIVGRNVHGSIGERGVIVPDAFYKAVLVRRSGRYRSIAFVMGNDSRRYYLSDCAVSVNELEDITGLDFFPGLDDSVEDSVEAQVNFKDWGITVHR